MRSGNTATQSASATGSPRARALHCARPATAAAVCISLLALVGCGAVGPDFKAPPDPSAARYLPGPGGDPAKVAGPRLASGGDVGGRWWSSFRSRDLDTLVEVALREHPDIAAADAALRVAQANLRVQGASLFPTIGADMSAVRAKNSPDNAPAGSPLYGMYTARVNVAYAPDAFGGVRRQIEAAGAQVEQQAFLREAALLTLSANVVGAAIQEASLRGQIAAVQRVVSLQASLLGVLRKQQALGQISMVEVTGQETALAQSRLLLIQLDKQLGQQRNLIAVLSGRTPAQAMKLRFTLASFNLPRKLPLSLPADMVRQRPDVRAAEANLHALSAQIGVALANRFPQFALSAQLGSNAAALSNLFSPGTAFWALAGSVAQPIFNAGALENKQKAAEAAFEQAQAQYRSTVLVGFQNVADVLRALDADTRALATARVAERSAAANVALVRKQLDLGQISLPVLLTAQQAYLQTSVARVQAEAARLTDVVALFQALGGGWWNRPGPLTSGVAAKADNPIATPTGDVNPPIRCRAPCALPVPADALPAGAAPAPVVAPAPALVPAPAIADVRPSPAEAIQP